MSNEISPAELDALTAAPENHKLLFENDSVRVLDTMIGPGQMTPLHSHCWPAALYVLTGSDFIRRDQNGTVTFDSRNAPLLPSGAALWIPPLPPHTLENIGTAAIRIIAVEIKEQCQY
ncbi:MAG TPA: hypothetical protein VN753_16915 [Terracidiphilus sp.]|nr:hypothetical protein [Terracidiphilus sp.]